MNLDNDNRDRLSLTWGCNQYDFIYLTDNEVEEDEHITQRGVRVMKINANLSINNRLIEAAKPIKGKLFVS